MSCPPSSRSGKKNLVPARETKASTAISRAELEALRQKTAELALEKPHKAAVILSDWINKAVRRQKTG